MNRLLILGAGGHGKVAAEIASLVGYDDIAFLDRDWPARATNGTWPIVGDTAPARANVFCAIGNNQQRATLMPENSPMLVHPASIISHSATIDPGTLVVAGAIVNPDAMIGRGVILNTGSSVDHDCTIGDFAHIAPGARLAGHVRVGARTLIGIGVVVKEGVTIGADVIVGAGAVVIADIPEGAHVIGAPAKPIKRKT